MKDAFKYLQKLNTTRESNTLRTLPDYSACTIDFVSNDYLGLARKKFLTAESHYFSGMGSRLIAGNSKSALYTEGFLAEIFHAEAAMLFNSGYDANVGFFSTIPQKGEIVLYDQAIHASVRDGLRLSSASSYGFKHNDLSDLELKLRRFQEKATFVVVEGVYSMDGDEAPIIEILQLMKEFKACLIVDEAHSLGVLGNKGLGKAEEYHSHPNLLARIVTFGKALGAHGAAVITKTDIRDYLIHACRSFIYTTALPPEAYTRIQNCFEYLLLSKTEREELTGRMQLFSNLFSKPKQHIQIIPVSGIQAIKTLTEEAKKEKIALKGVWSPTVAEGEERLRLSLHSFNTEGEILKLYHFLRTNNYV